METLFIGKNLIFLPETTSTNSYAIELLKNVNLPEGSVVHTAHQTGGRGQRGNLWESDEHCNLTASVILRPEFLDVQNHFFLYQVFALACYDTLAGFMNDSHFDIKIKWPNDILVNSKKIAGVLIENQLINNKILSSVGGIGINLNQENFNSPNAISLRNVTGGFYSSRNVLTKFCKHLEGYYLLLRKNKFEHIKSLYLERLFGLRTMREFVVEDKVRQLFINGISARGLLHLRDEEGQDFEADVKQLTWIY